MMGAAYQVESLAVSRSIPVHGSVGLAVITPINRVQIADVLVKGVHAKKCSPLSFQPGDIGGNVCLVSSLPKIIII